MNVVTRSKGLRAWAALATGAALAGAVGFAAAPEGAGNEKDDIPPRVGLLDLGRAMQNDPGSADDRAEIEAWVETQRLAIEARKSDIADLQVELGEYKEGSKEAMSRAEALMLEQYRLELSAERLDAELERKRADATKAVYNRVVAAAEKVRVKLGYEVVLQVNPMALTGRDVSETISEVIARTVLCYDPDLDVTDDVIDLLKQ